MTTPPGDPAAPGPGLPPPPAPGTPQAMAWPAAPSPAPARRAQPALIGGVILIVVGAALLVGQVADLSAAWPVWIIVPGLAMLAGSLFIPPRGGLGLAIPGAIVAMVGTILAVQEAYDLYSTWAYAWALVAPTSVGIAILVYGLAQRDGELVADGLRTTFIGLVLFAAFALFFEGVVGLNGYAIANLDQVLPYLAIGLGVVMVIVSLFTGRRHRDTGAKS
jgi:hypothetical protein